jgi:hypothetical protein
VCVSAPTPKHRERKRKQKKENRKEIVSRSDDFEKGKKRVMMMGAE